MSESEKQDGSLPITNPFCMGEWVTLSPSGENLPTLIRRSAIVAVQRYGPQLPNAQRPHGVKITVAGAQPGESIFEINFLHPEHGARDADLLMQACLRRQTAQSEMYTFMHSVASALFALAVNPDAIVEPNDRGLHQIAERMRQARCITVVIDP